MNKGQLKFLLFSFVLLLCGCNKNNEELILLDVESDFVHYNAKNITAYTVDQEGSLYTSELINDIFDYSLHEQPNGVTLHKYDLEGHEVFSHEFDNTIDFIGSMTVYGSKVYFTTSGYNSDGPCEVLYSYDIETDSLERLYDFNYLYSVKQLIYHNDRIYLLENIASAPNNETKGSNTFTGQSLVYYSFIDENVYGLGVSNPIGMALNEDGTLLIYNYLNNEGYNMLKYDPTNDSIKVIARLETSKFKFFATSDFGNKIIYTNDTYPRGLVISEITSMNEEAELYPDATNFHPGIYHVKGQVYCMTNSRDLVRFTLNTFQKDNRAIEYILAGFQPDEPFGCGYSMKRTKLEEDKFALKILAQDKDYDLCIMNTSSYSSYNIKKNGAFYPLNEVKGINEYLESCFPYVKEAATDEDGNIWMLPIGVDMPGLLVNEDNLTKENIELKNNMTYEEFYKIQENMTKELYERTSCNSYVIYLTFFAQCFNNSMDIDNNVFGNTMRLFQKYDSHMPTLNYTNMSREWYEDIIYDYNRNSSYYRNLLEQSLDDLPLRIYSMPKINASNKNIGACTFLAVNAHTDNHEETLSYLADWISYTMEQEETPLYFKQPIPKEGTLRKSLYDLYENGEITFYVDRDVYVDGFFDVVENGADIEEYIKETKRKLDKYFNE
ncbi:MAG: extracellular solute-binding protein [Clostridiales bacterium]|nr:extracellular solute-binding protein [Clostridiales bacterium]